jgi:hypothetical protein
MAMMVLSAARVIEIRLDPPIGLRRDESDGAGALRKGKFTGGAARNGIVVAAVVAAAALAACSDVSHPRTVAASPAPHDQAAPVAGAALGDDGLKDLAAMTLTCPRAGLNAAARQAAQVPSQGTYQFAYFHIIDDSHHSLYEIHFESNYEGEDDLKYCVSLYCQQGWDPKTTVALMSEDRQPGGVAAHGAECGHQQAPATR